MLIFRHEFDPAQTAASRQRDHGCLTNNGRFAMTFFARLIRKHLDTPHRVPFDPSGTILGAGERGGHSLAFYLWALSQSI
jgi:hypothetical protein